MIDTDTWPRIQARDFKPWTQGRRPVRLIVMHDMEYPERITAAEDVARYFQHPDKPSSAHICVDSDSIVQCVKDNDIAYAAPGANADGIQIELAGYGKQSRGEWLDPYGILLLNLAANAVAQYCLKYDIPVRRLTNAQLADKSQRGIIGHVQASQVFKQSDHTDPGPNFPWDFLLERATVFHKQRKAHFGV
jgi:N-acetyl-anhydromuramyl-L-alanine amidase AmpD